MEQNPMTARLLETIKAHPELPVVPMVDEEVVADDSHTWWLGQFGMCSIDSYYSDEEAERVWLKADDEEDLLDRYVDLHEEECDGLTDEEIDRRAHEWIEHLPWIKAIIVWIDI